MRKLAIIVLVLIALPIIWYKWNFPTVSYRYRLSVAVEVDGQVRSGSSVNEISFSFNPDWTPPSWGRFNEYLYGQAVLIDLGTRGALIAALGGQNYDYCSINARALVGRAYELPAERRPCDGYPVTVENEQRIAQRRGSVELTADNLPAFFWLSNPRDLSTAKQVKPAEFASVIGDETRLVSARVEVTSDPIVIDIDKKLPAYAALYGPPNNRNDYTAPSGLTLGWRQFISRGNE